MFKIASRVLSVPSNVSVSFQENQNDFFILFEGPLGSSKRKFLSIVDISIEGNKIFTSSKTEENYILAGTYNSLIMNMIIGVTEGFKEVIRIKGNGYKVIKKDNNFLEFFLGKSHSDILSIPDLINVKIVGSSTLELVSVDKELIGNFSSSIRNLRKPNVYKERGVYLSKEDGRTKLKKKKSSGK